MDIVQPKLDWHPPSSIRRLANAPYRISTAFDWNLEVPLRSRSYTRVAWLNQFSEGACTGFGLAHCMSIGYRRWPMDNAKARVYYAGAKQFDEWAGEDYEGSSVQGAMAFAKSVGNIHHYYWAETPEEFKHGIAQFGAIEVGTWWRTGMFDTDSNGYIHPTGDVEGGHAYCVGGVDLVRNTARVDNSWGEAWGRRGSALIDLDDLFTLIFDAGGEAALPRKNLYRA